MMLRLAHLTCLLSLATTAYAEKLVLYAGGAEDAVHVPATRAKLREPFGTEFDTQGNAWIIEMVSGNRLLKVDTQGQLTHIAGQLKPGFSGDGGPALEAQFHGPHNLAVTPDGKVLIGDTWNGCVRVVDPAKGSVEQLRGYSVPVKKARGNGPYCISLNPAGTELYIADLLQIWAVDLKTHQKRLIAGNGKKGIPQDGATATAAPLVDPRAVAVDSKGQVYILERGGNALRVVDTAGRIKTVVNASGKAGGTGDGGPALAATMSGPKHLCVDRDDSVIIADAESHLVRRYLPTDGSIQRVAGTGKKGSAGLGGPPDKTELARPHGVTIHPQSGELYITDSYNDRVLRMVK
jgi:DNA-binding beta-propeller fold protein YncE